MKFCTNCGSNIENMKFCSECGFKIISSNDQSDLNKTLSLPPFEAKFGSVLKKNVKTEGNHIYISSGRINPTDYLKIYLSPPTLMNSGYLYFSRNGEPPTSEAMISITGFTYTNKQSKEMDTFLDILSGIEGLEIEVSSTPLTSMRLEKSVSQNEAKKEKTRANKAEAKKLKCPKCKSTNLQYAGNKKKGFSVGKAIGGAALTGGFGTLAGFAGKAGKKENWICMDCGNKFSK